MRAPSSTRQLVALAMAAIALGVARPVFAADATAEALFQQAVELMKNGDFAAACPKLEASQRREPRSGTLLNLANCWEHEGKTATAWAHYKDAARLARSENRREYADKAVKLAAALEPRLCRLRIDVARWLPGETVKIDGAPIDAAIAGTPVPIDPGDHTVAASAPGFADWSTAIAVRREGEVHVVAIPTLERRAGEPANAAPASSSPIAPSADRQPEPGQARPKSNANSTTRAIPGWVWPVGGAGIALAAVAVAFRVDQSAAASALDQHCGPQRDHCPPTSQYDYPSDQARERRDFGLFVGLGAVGIVALGAAIVGTATAPAKPASGASMIAPVGCFARSCVAIGTVGTFE